MKLTTYIASLFALTFLLSCGESESSYSSINGFAQGSTYRIIFEYNDAQRVQSGVNSIFDEIDRSISLYNENSLLSRLNSGVTDSLDHHIIRCIEVSEGISRESGGAYDITIKPVVEAWGFIGGDRVSTPNIDSLMQYVGYQGIVIKNGRLIKSHKSVQIDLNATAQGYTVDVVGDMLSSLGVDNYLVEIGGEIVCKGVNSKGVAWVIGIDKPIEGSYIPGSSLQSTIRMSDRALATSGNYRKFHINERGEKIVHTIDAKTGYSKISNLLSVTVVAESALLADGYSTMMMILGIEESKAFLIKHPEVEAFFVYSDHTDTLRTYHSATLEISAKD